MTPSLIEFLLARITEDEAVAHEAIPSSGDDTWAAWVCDEHGHVAMGEDRMLAECEAKRRIVDLMGYILESFSAQNGGPGQLMWDDVNRRERHHANEVMRTLAALYSDHPDYREEWRP